MSNCSSESSDRASELGYLIEEMHERVQKLGSFDRAFEINTYCDELVDRVMCTIESAIKHLKSVQMELVKEINSYRYELLDPARARPELNADVDKLQQESARLVEEFGAFYKIWAPYLRQTGGSVADSAAEHVQAHVNYFNPTVKAVTKRLRRLAFNGRFLKFKENQNFAIDKDQIGRLQISPDETTDAIDRDNAEICLMHQLNFHHQNVINSVLFFPNAEIVSCSADGTVRVWNFRNERPVACFCDNASTLTLLSNGRVATGTDDGCVKVWDLTQKRLVKLFRQHAATVHSLRALQSGRLASCSLDGMVKIWNLSVNATKDCLRTISCCEPGQAIVSPVGLLQSGGLVTCSYHENNGLLRAWNSKSGRLLRQINTALSWVSSLLVLPNEVVLGAPGVIQIFDLNDGAALVRTIMADASLPRVLSLVLLPSGLLLSGVSKRSGTFLQLWNLKTGQLVRATPVGHSGPNLALGVSHNGNMVATASGDRTIRIWAIY